MSWRRRFPVFGSRAFACALVVLGLAALALQAGRDRAYERLTEDERDYLYAAANLAQSRTLSFSPPGTAGLLPDAYREPGFPFLIAALWRTARLEAPASASEVEAVFIRAPLLYDSIRWLQIALLALAAAASGWAAWQLGGAKAGAAAFLLVAASPALHERGGMVMTEVAAAAGMALVAATLVAASRSRVAGAIAATAILAFLPLLRAEAVLLLPLAGLAGWWATPVDSAAEGRSGRPARRRRRAFAALAAVAIAALPSALWMARNQGALGVATLSDRSGLALAVRAQLDREVERVGVVPALLAWTPLDRAQAEARVLAPSSTLVDYRWTGPGNFFTRTIVDWGRERKAPGADSLAVDARYRRDALRSFRAHPGAHGLAAIAVSWRGLFAERSPPWLHPFDLRFGIGVLHLAAVAGFAALALARRDRLRLAFLLPFAISFAAHALGTEFLPRYGVPLLPCAWVAVAVLVLGERRVESGPPARRVDGPSG